MCQLRHTFRLVVVAGAVSAFLTGLTLLSAPAIPRATGQAFPAIVVTNTNDSGPGSLRQAIADAESGVVIVFDPSLAGGAIRLTSGQLLISRSLTIDASAALSLTVDGNRASRVFVVAEDATVGMVALNITGGQAPANDEGSNGHGGGILNLGGLTLTGCRVHDNQAGHGVVLLPPDDCPYVPYSGGDGGGIYNRGRLVLRDTIVSNNAAGGGAENWVCTGVAGGSGGNGGGIANIGALEVSDGALQDNRANEGGAFAGKGPPGSGGHGGGLYSTGVVTITHALIVNNAAGSGVFDTSSYSSYRPGSPGGSGGGIYLAASGRLAMTDGVMRGNRAGDGVLAPDQRFGSGGGLYTEGRAAITGSVFTANLAGAAQGSSGSIRGGNGGAIANHGMLTLRYSTLDGNASGAGRPGDSGDSGGNGGGLWNRGTAQLINNDIVNNIAGRGGDGVVGDFRVGGTPGGDGGDGGGVWNDGALTLTQTTVDSNQAGDGGLGGSDWPGGSYVLGLPGGSGGSGAGVWSKGLLLIQQSAITGNAAGAAGAGRDVAGQGGPGGDGGHGGGVFSSGVAVLVNATVSGNAAGAGGAGGSSTATAPAICGSSPCRAGDGGDGGSGGGVYNSYSLVIDNSTVATNGAADAGAAGQGVIRGVDGVAGAGGGISGVFAARDTILADNAAPQTGKDCAGRLVAGGYNLIRNPDDCAIDPGVVHNLLRLNPLLQGLAVNAPGTTATHALSWASPAVDAGSCSAGAVGEDQRGVLRPQGRSCDIGAYEFVPVHLQFYWLPLMSTSAVDVAREDFSEPSAWTP